jgi:hypothetical protein
MLISADGGGGSSTYDVGGGGGNISCFLLFLKKHHTDKKENQNFLINKRKLRRSGCKVIYIYICTFPQKLESPSSYMTLQPIPSEFPYTVYEEIKFSFSFLSVHGSFVV